MSSTEATTTDARPKGYGVPSLVEKHGGVDVDSPHVQLIKSDLPKLELGAIRRALPPEVFVKDLGRSVRWMIFDIVVVYGLSTLVYQAYLNEYYWALPFLYFATGLEMASLFCIGHDCGHGSFSNYEWINDICGLITHGALLIPFTAWQRSHRYHHQNHNHFEKDWSFTWDTDPKFDDAIGQWFNDHMWLRAALTPFIGWIWYLVVPNEAGGHDGNHYFPNVFPNDRLWKGYINWKDTIMCWISTIVVGLYIYGWINFFYQGSVVDFLVCYLPSWIWYAWFTVTITYLQHHSPETKVYDDTTWDYTLAAFETTDRSFGSIIDWLQHHIANCHVMHHLFFTKIPHYNLEKATEALKLYLQENNLMHVYKNEPTLDFFPKVFKYIAQSGQRGTLVTKNDLWFAKKKDA